MLHEQYPGPPLIVTVQALPPSLLMTKAKEQFTISVMEHNCKESIRTRTNLQGY